jgi:glutamine amidotransferase
MVVIVDYGAGNLTSVSHVLTHLGHEHTISSNPVEILKADHIIFPGVGAAGAAMDDIKSKGLDLALRTAFEHKIPTLGICVGCQVALDSSEENGGVECLGIIEGEVLRFESQPGLKIPHMGWNTVSAISEHFLFEGIPADSEFYFVHSFYPSLKNEAEVIAHTEYAGVKFDAMFGKDNLVLTQCHVEKSGVVGLKLMDNFCKWSGQC